MIDNQLPDTFEKFSEERRNGFLKAKAIKDEGGLIAGVFCTFAPEEVFDAAGIHMVGICGMSEETISAAESDLPKNLCPLIKSSYGFAITDKCPYIYFADIIIGETTCDGKKKMYELLNEIVDTYIMHLPQGLDAPYAVEMWRSETRRLIETLENKFGVSITDEKLREASRKRNEARKARLSLMNLQKLGPPPIYGKDIYKVLEGSNYTFDCDATILAIKNMVSKIEDDYKNGNRPVPADAKRILITGCPIGGVFEKTVGIIEDNGGVAVCFENCGGIKPAISMVDTEAEDIVTAIADRYLDIGCAVMSPNNKRAQMIPQLAKEFAVDGIVDIMLQACQPYSVERYTIKSLAKELDIPYMSVETDYSKSDIGQLSTRLSAFLEML